MRWLIRRLGGKRGPATLLAGILTLWSLIPVLVLAQEVRLPGPGEARVAANRSLALQPERRFAQVSGGKPVPSAQRSEGAADEDGPQRPGSQSGSAAPATADAPALASTQRPAPTQEPPSQPKSETRTRPQASRSRNSQSQIPARGWLTPGDWELLARAVHAEARGESLEGQVAVAAVILNRREDPRFPNRIADIVYEPGAFEAVTDGQINLKADATAYRAVALALKGWDPTHGALYYWNPARSSSRWIWSRPVVRVIGQHWFAR